MTISKTSYADAQAVMMRIQLENATAIKAANDEFRKKIDALGLPDDLVGSSAAGVISQIVNQTKMFDQNLTDLIQTLDSQVNFGTGTSAARI